jgi:hypothetical protein
VAIDTAGPVEMWRPRSDAASFSKSPPMPASLVSVGRARSVPYLPVSRPPPSGDQAVTARSSAAAIGSNSRSTVRSTSEYGICRAENGVNPRSSATVTARATTQAGASEMPT